MKFIVSYITEDEIIWRGFESVVHDQGAGISENLPDSLRSGIRVIEAGKIKRNASDVRERSDTSESTDEPSPEHSSDQNRTDERVEHESRVSDKVPEFTYDTGTGFLAACLTSDIELDLPFSDKKKAEKVIPLQIQDRLPYDLENCHSVIHQPVVAADATTSKYFYSAIKREDLHDIISACDRASVKICSLHPEIYAGAGVFNDAASNTESRYKILIIEKSDSIIFNASKAGSLIHARNIRISDNKEIAKLQLNAQLGVSIQYLHDQSESEDSTPGNEIVLFHIPCKDFTISLDLKNSEFPLTEIPLIPSEIITNADQAEPDLLHLGVCAYIGLLLKDPATSITDYQLSKKIYPNLRSGEFRYRAPLTEIKNSLIHELVPFTLLTFFTLLSLVLMVLSPLKQERLNQEKIHSMAKEALQNPFLAPGKELIELEERVYTLENELGDLSSLQSLSSIEWLYLFSDLIPSSIPLEIDTLSITTKGVSFRGTIPDYPTSGRISSLLDSLKAKHPEKFCTVDLKTEDLAIGVSSKQIRVEIALCE
jgi:hypothetical protein